MSDGDVKTVYTVETMFETLDALNGVEPASLLELMSTVGIPASAICVYLSMLIERGLVVEDTGEYRRSLRFLEAGRDIQQRVNIARLLRNEVKEFSRVMGEIVGVVIGENGKRVTLYRSIKKEATADKILTGNRAETC